jgi:hypothetical protein
LNSHYIDISNYLVTLLKIFPSYTDRMPATDNDNTPPRISINLDDIKGHEGDSSPGGGTPKSSSGWDGKLRLEKKIELVNPEAISDPEYSDEEQVLAGETIEADEGTMLLLLVPHMAGALGYEEQILRARAALSLLATFGIQL